jgi:hypothetical protein
MNNKTFNYDELEKLARKISKIRNQKNLEKIRDIIINNNPDLKITENSNGVFMCFNNLTNNTYLLLDNFIKNITAVSSNSSFENINSTISETFNNNITFDDNSALSNSKVVSNSIKLSNKEKNILKRKMYANQLDIENNTFGKTSPSDDNLLSIPSISKTEDTTNKQSIFIKKTKKN